MFLLHFHYILIVRRFVSLFISCFGCCTYLLCYSSFPLDEVDDSDDHENEENETKENDDADVTMSLSQDLRKDNY